MSGLSIANNLLANAVQYNLNKNQAALQQSVTRLSSGLRINTASDDPSGNAIAANLQTQVDGFNQAVQNVQDASNAAQVASGALSTIDSARGLVSVSGTLYSAGGVTNDFDGVNIMVGQIATADVGVTSYIKISQNVAALTNPSNPAFNFQSGACERGTVCGRDS